MTNVYDFTATTIDGAVQPLREYRGKVLLVVNTASKCGFTPQYEGLETLHKTYADRGLVVLGFPCDQFGNQEPGDEAAIKEFCSLTYDVTFPMFAKIDVNGTDTHPLYGWLEDEKSDLLGGKITWNFTKFLIDGAGNAVNRYAPTTKPESLVDDIEKLLPA